MNKVVKSLEKSIKQMQDIRSGKNEPIDWEDFWYEITTPFYKIKRFCEHLYCNLKPSKLKHLCSFIKMWWNYSSWTSWCGLKFLHWHISNMLETSLKNDIPSNQNKENKDMRIFLELLRRNLEEDYGETDYSDEQWIKKDNRRYKENKEMMMKYFNKHDRWGI